MCASVKGYGTQGVVIPKSNVRHLMLREGVVAAAREGVFISMQWAMSMRR